MPIDTVNAGDIISSDLMNSIIETVNRLEEEVENLGSLNRVRIEQISPLAGNAVGEFITIEGANFESPAGENIVRVGTRLVEDFSTPSTSRVLTVRIPLTLSVSDPLGEELEVSVSNDFGTARTMYRVFPEPTQPPILIGSLTGTGPFGQLQTEDPATLTGSGFAPSPENNVLTFFLARTDGTVGEFVVDPADIDPSSDEENVVFTVPPIPEIPANPATIMTFQAAHGERTSDPLEGVRVRGT